MSGSRPAKPCRPPPTKTGMGPYCPYSPDGWPGGGGIGDASFLMRRRSPSGRIFLLRRRPIDPPALPSCQDSVSGNLWPLVGSFQTTCCSSCAVHPHLLAKIYMLRLLLQDEVLCRAIFNSILLRNTRAQNLCQTMSCFQMINSWGWTEELYPHRT